MERTCENCAHWDRHPITKDSVLTGLGDCRRYAPRPKVVPDDHETSTFDAWWPITADINWCGEWLRAPDRAPDEG